MDYGRKVLNVPVTNIYGALKRHRSVQSAAKELGCSCGYVYKVLKANGLTAADLINGKSTDSLSHICDQDE